MNNNLNLLYKAHEVFIEVEESGSVITWDFDVMRQDINFNVFKLLIKVQPSTLLSCARGIYINNTFYCLTFCFNKSFFCYYH